MTKLHIGSQAFAPDTVQIPRYHALLVPLQAFQFCVQLVTCVITPSEVPNR